MNFQDALDNHYMLQALELAEKAFDCDEIPIGAIVVAQDDLVLGRGYNQTQACFSQSRHAEVIAIEQAGRVKQDWRLDGCALYVTLEPCLMCVSLTGLSRIERIIYGARSPLFGYHLDKESLPDLYQRQIKGVSAGVRAEEAKQLLKKFFETKRKKSEQLR